MRAIAVLSVIFFHAGLPGFSFGYVGVDVFFVISGYVITNSIVRGVRGSTFSVLGFYERRVRRIVPALFAMLFVVVLAALVIELPFELVRTADGLLGALAFVANFVFWKQSGYFAAAAETKPLLHTWSLAVEEQFYLLYPAFLAIVLTRAPKLFRPALAFFLALSLSAHVLLVRDHPNAAFFLSVSRGWEILLGALVAPPQTRWSLGKRSAEIVSVLGLSLVLFALGFFSSSLDCPGLHTYSACLGTGLVIFANAHLTATQRTLAWRPIAFVGAISYSLYLWHWPLFAFAETLTLHFLSRGLVIGLIAAAFVLAYASWRWIERPFRVPNGVLTSRRFFAAVACATVLLGSAGIVLRVENGWASRFSPRVAAISAFESYDRSPRFVALSRGSCNSSRIDFSDYDSARCLSRMPDRKNVLLWGDSHAADLAEPIADVVKGLDAHFMQATKSECPSLFDPAPRQQCRSFVELVDATESGGRVDVAILSSHWSDDLGLLHTTVDRFVHEGTRVIVIGPAPEYRASLVSILARYIADGESASADPDHFLSDDFFSRDHAMADAFDRPPLVTYVSIARDLCSERHCRSVVDGGAPVLWDTSHFTYEGADFVVHHTLAETIRSAIASGHD